MTLLARLNLLNLGSKLRAEEQNFSRKLNNMTKGKTEVPVDFEDICGAFEFGSVDNRHYLDLQTGEIIFISDDLMDEEERGKFDEKIEQGLGERYIGIPYVSSEEGYQEMIDFIETVEDVNLKEKLYVALDGSGCFRRFKDLLFSYPKEREHWFKFHDV